jgi:hypothetical protein
MTARRLVGGLVVAVGLSLILRPMFVATCEALGICWLM